MDGVICPMFMALITVVKEIVIEKTVMHVWEKEWLSKKELLIPGWENFQLQSLEYILINNSPFGWIFCLFVNLESCRF